jgi:TonB-dependent starch-binding outer membrane protein SusC
VHTDRLKTNIDATILRNTTRAPYPWWGLLAEFVLANPVNASETRPYGELDYGINGVLQYDNSQEVNTTTLSGSASYAWTPDLQSSVTLGLNETDLQEILFVPLGASPRAGPGQRQITDRARSNLTLDLKSSWNVRIGERLTSTLAVGGQSFWEDLTQQVVDVRNFPSPTLQTLRGGSEIRQVDEFQEQVINAGVFVQEQIGINDRLFLTAGVRFDGNSAFGENFGMETYPKFGGSWVVSDEPFWSVPLVDLFRLRAAYGTSGLQPGAFDAQRTWAATRGINNNTAVRPLNLGNPDLKPERSTERELGAELGLFGGRLGLEVVYFDQETTDALLPRQGPPTQGFLNPQLTNIGRLESHGIESSLDLRLIERPGLSWSVDASFTSVDQMVVDMGGVAPYNIAGGQRYSRIQEGYAPGAVVAAVTDPANPYTVSVPIEELTSLSEIQPNWLKAANGLDSLVFIGNSSPTWTVSLGSTLSLPAGVGLRALLGGAGGFVISNETEFIREGIGITESVARKQQALANPATTAEERHRIADEYGRKHPRVPTDWMEDGDYVQLSELSLSLPVPQRLSRRLGLDQTSILVAGRNLALFTGYSGIITPGTSRSRYGGTFLQNIDYFGAPVPRRLVLSLRTNF